MVLKKHLYPSNIVVTDIGHKFVKFLFDEDALPSSKSELYKLIPYIDVFNLLISYEWIGELNECNFYFTHKFSSCKSNLMCKYANKPEFYKDLNWKYDPNNIEELINMGFLLRIT